jgi:hypothetical protein
MFNEYEWYIPDILKPIKDYQALGVAVDNATTELGVAEDLVYNNSFIISCDEDTLTRFEESVGIVYTTKPSNAIRRANLFILVGKTTPFTWRRFIGLITQVLTDEGDKFQAIKDFNNFRIVLKTRTIVTPFQIEFIRKFVSTVVPANMIIDYQTLYNKWYQVQKYTWDKASVYDWRAFSEDFAIIE